MGSVARSARALGLVLWGVLATSLVLAVAGRALPEPLPVEAAPEEFSAGRAGRVLARIARRPHPVASEEHACVLETLLEQLDELGLETNLQWTVRGLPLTNVSARLPGYDSTGTLLLLAHYDSVPTGPGAGDDSIGVSTWLEVLRALRARAWQPRNDVLLLLTDGEELGLRGAIAFVREHPLAEAVRCVVNLEAIGNGGPAVLFELGPENGARARLFGEVVPDPTGTSLGDAVYRRMPNDTDLSVFLAHGVRGFNLAVTSGSPAYHAPHDTPENLDARSLQHMGECALALAEALGERDLGALDAPDVTFFDLLGRGFIVYPRALDGLLAGLGIALGALAWRRARVTRREVLRECLRILWECALAAGLTLGAWWLTDRAFALVTAEPVWIPGNTTSGALLFVALVLASLGAATLGARPGRAERGVAALALLALATLAALVLMPGAAFAFALPLVLAGLAQRACPTGLARGPGAAVLVVLAFGLALLLGLPIAHLLVQLFQRSPERAVLLFTAILTFFAAPFEPALRALDAAGRRSTPGLLALAGFAALASCFVARVLEWRQGALWP